MPVDNEKLVRQTFKMLGNLDNTSKDEIASRARLLALALQQAERAYNEIEVHNEVLKEAMEQVLSSVKNHMDLKFQNPDGGFVVDLGEVMKQALSPYADSAYARSIIKAKKEGKKAVKEEKKATKKAGKKRKK